MGRVLQHFQLQDADFKSEASKKKKSTRGSAPKFNAKVLPENPAHQSLSVFVSGCTGLMCSYKQVTCFRMCFFRRSSSDKVCVHTTSASTPANSGSLNTDGPPTNSQLQHLLLPKQLDSSRNFLAHCTSTLEPKWLRIRMNMLLCLKPI